MNDTERIKTFISIAEKVRDSKFIQEQQTVSFSFNFEVGKPLVQNLAGFDEDDLRSMLLDLRKFTLGKDGVRFTDMCDLLNSKTKDKSLKVNIGSCRAQYEELMSHSAIKIIINNKVEKNLEIIKTWFYGHYFHENPEHKENLQKLGTGQPFHKFNFIQLIQSLSYLSIVLSNNAKKVLLEIPSEKAR